MKMSPATQSDFQRITDSSFIAVFAQNFCTKSQMKVLLKDLDALMADGQSLKKGTHSDVSRIKWNNRDIVVKRYNHAGIFHSLRHTIKGSRASRSWQYGRHFESLDVTTPGPLAFIEQRKHGLLWQSYLVTEYVDGQRFDNFLRNEGITEQQRLEMFRKIIQMLENLWNSRITHGDLKHTNILIAKDRPVLTDLDAMMLHRCSLLYKVKRKKDIRRFFKKTDIPPSIYRHYQSIISDIVKPIDELLHRFKKVRFADWSLLIVSDFPENKIADFIRNVSVSDNHGEHFTQVPSSNYARVFKCSISSDGKDRSFFLKQYLTRSKMDFIKHIFRPSRARRAFFASLMLQKNGFDAPDVIGLFERRAGLLCTDNLFLTRDVTDALPLPKYLDKIRHQSGKTALAKKRAFIRAFAQTLGRMHNKGIFHGDLRLNNVLVVPDDPGEKLYFIDNERTKKKFRLPARLCLKNLVQLNMFRDGISNTDRMRFIKTYLSYNIDIRGHSAGLIEKVIAKTNKRLLKKGLIKISNL